MARLLLVVGALPGPVGKTGLVLALLEGLREVGLAASPVKPVALVDWYRSYGLYLEWRERGFPFAGEAEVYREAGARGSVEELNPVCIVSTPLRPEYFLEEGSPGQLYVYEADSSRSTVAARVSVVGEPVVSYGFVNWKLVSRGVSLITAGELEAVLRRLDRVERVWGYREYGDAVSSAAAEAVERALEFHSERSLAVVVEGLGDAAYLPGLGGRVDLVAAVYPGSVAVYGGDRYVAAVALRGRRAVSFRDVFPLLRPLGVYRVEPVAAGMLPEDIYRRNRGVVEKILGFLG